MKKILAVILAGGLGRRMGGARKPLIELDGLRLIDRAVDFARSQGLAAAVNLAEITPETTAALRDLGLPFVSDAAPDHAGPLAGVLGALDHAAAKSFDAVLSLPCDCPFLPENLVARLTEAAVRTRDGLACAASGGRTHPVIAVWPVALRDDLRRALIDEGMRKLDAFQCRYDRALVEWASAPRDPFFNINSPDDLAVAEALSRMKSLDLRGLKCPLPVLKTRKALAGLAPGDLLEVSCTDPMSVVDLPHMLRETGDILEAQSREGGVATFLIRREVG